MQHLTGVWKCVELEVGVEKPAAQRTVHRRHALEGVVERLLGDGPEIGVAARERQRPGVFELLGAPDVREAVRIRARGIAVAGEETVTSAMLGDLEKNQAQRAEFLSLAPLEEGT